MSKAEERALEAYPEDIQLFVESQEEPGKWLPVDENAELRYGYKRGYEQAEKDTIEQAMECELVCIKDRLLAVLPIKEFQWTAGDKIKIIIVNE